MKKLIYSNYRVEVYPCDPWFVGGKSYEYKHRAWVRATVTVAEEIKRHCNIGHLSVTHDTTEVCSFCGSLWESPQTCCKQAVDEG